MYEVKKPTIYLCSIYGYDANNTYISNEKSKKFNGERELIEFLARHHIPRCNTFGKEIRDSFDNEYMDNQAINIPERINRYEILYPESLFNHFRVNDQWKINRYRFWIDIPGKPIIDVRKYKEEVAKEYHRIKNIKPHYSYKFKQKMGRKRHRDWTYHYPNRVRVRVYRAACGLIKEDEYKQLVHPEELKGLQDFWFNAYERSCGTGWKDNSGNRYRHQWEAKAIREFKKIRKNKIYEGSDYVFRGT